MWVRVTLVAVAVWGVTSGTAVTQQATVSGTVVADSTAIPLPAAEVLLETTMYRARTDHRGRFRIGGIDVGRYRLTARAVGFRQVTVDLVLGPGDSLEVDFTLRGEAVSLAPLEVTAAAPRRVSAKMAAFDERRRLGFGRHLTRADLARYDHGPITTALRNVAGVKLIPIPCSGGYAAGTLRGGDTGRNSGILCVGIRGRYRMPPACYFTV